MKKSTSLQSEISRAWKLHLEGFTKDEIATVLKRSLRWVQVAIKNQREKYPANTEKKAIETLIKELGSRKLTPKSISQRIKAVFKVAIKPECIEAMINGKKCSNKACNKKAAKKTTKKVAKKATKKTAKCTKKSCSTSAPSAKCTKKSCKKAAKRCPKGVRAKAPANKVGVTSAENKEVFLKEVLKARIAERKQQDIEKHAEHLFKILESLGCKSPPARVEKRLIVLDTEGLQEAVDLLMHLPLEQRRVVARKIYG